MEDLLGLLRDASNTFFRAGSWQDAADALLRRLCLASGADSALVCRLADAPETGGNGLWIAASGRRDQSRERPGEAVEFLTNRLRGKLAPGSGFFTGGAPVRLETTQPSGSYREYGQRGIAFAAPIAVRGSGWGLLALMFGPGMADPSPLAADTLAALAGMIGAAVQLDPDCLEGLDSHGIGQRHECRHRRLLDVSPEPVICCSADGSPLFVNDAFRESYGWSPEELEAMQADTGPDRYNPWRTIRKVTAGRGPQRFEIKCRTRRGHQVIVQVCSATVFDSRKKPDGTIVIVRDITERRQIEMALWESEERLTRIIDNMPVLMEATDQQGTIVYWNREAERVTGYAAMEIVGRPDALARLYPDPDYRHSVLAARDQMGDDFRGFEAAVTCSNGERRLISWACCASEAPIPGWASWSVGVDVTGMDHEPRRAFLRTRSGRLAENRKDER